MYDIYPDVAERLGALKRGGWLARRWRRRSGRAMAAAEGVITLGAYMAETLRAHLPAGAQARIEVIPNWADTEAIRPRPKAGNAFAEQHGLVDKFVVMYSGSFGAVHDVDSMIEAAARLRDLPDVHFMLIGGGTQETAVARMVRERALPNLTLLPLQPREVLPLSLAAADCAIVCLDAGYEGVAVPSKAYSCLAAGSALVAVTQPGTELADLVAEEGCGVVVPPRSPDALEAAIRGLHANRAGLAAARAAARRAAEETYSRGRGTARTLEVLAAWLGGSPKGSAPPASPDDNRAGTA
jgi:glycosyltransferase involved in cell wall biosynthesis